MRHTSQRVLRHAAATAAVVLLGPVSLTAGTVPAVADEPLAGIVASVRVLRPDGTPAAGAAWVLEPSGYSGPAPYGVVTADGMIHLPGATLAALPHAPEGDPAVIPVVLEVVGGVDRDALERGDTSADVASIGFNVDLTRLPVALDPSPAGRTLTMVRQPEAVTPLTSETQCYSFGTGADKTVEVCSTPHFDAELNDVGVPIADQFGAGLDWRTGLRVGTSKTKRTSWFVKFGGGDWDFGEGQMTTTSTDRTTGGLPTLTGVKWGLNYTAVQHDQYARWETKACGFFGLFCHQNEKVLPYEFTGSVTKENELRYVEPYDMAGTPGPTNPNCTRQYEARFARGVGREETLAGSINLPGHGREELPVSVEWTGETTSGTDLTRWWDPLPSDQTTHANQYLFVPGGLDPWMIANNNGEAVCPEDAVHLVYTDSSNKDLTNTGPYEGTPATPAVDCEGYAKKVCDAI